MVWRYMFVGIRVDIESFVESIKFAYAPSAALSSVSLELF